MQYKDGKCWTNGQRMHFSHPAHDRRMGLPVNKMRGVFFYTGRVHLGSLYNTGSTHRWRTRTEKNGYTMCARKVGAGAGKRVGGKSSFKVKGVRWACHWHAADLRQRRVSFCFGRRCVCVRHALGACCLCAICARHALDSGQARVGHALGMQ